MLVPSVDQLKRPTLEYLAAGITNSDEIRKRLARDLDVVEALDPQVEASFAKYVNNHAWTLVRLQQDGLIEKLSPKTYIVTKRGRAFLRRSLRPGPVESPKIGRMPPWARRLISAANQRNGSDIPRFTENDLMSLWERCGGKCAITRLQFTDEKVGTGRARRAFAPSLDKIDPEGAYTVDNCRLVMVAINFALNAWGEEVYLRLARAAVRTADESK